MYSTQWFSFFLPKGLIWGMMKYLIQQHISSDQETTLQHRKCHCRQWPWHSLVVLQATLFKHGLPNRVLEYPVEWIAEAQVRGKTCMWMECYPTGYSLHTDSKTFIQYCVSDRKNSGFQEPKHRSRSCPIYKGNQRSTGNSVFTVSATLSSAG